MNKTFVTIGFLAATTVGFLAGQWFVTETPWDQCVRTHMEARAMALELPSSRRRTVTFENGETSDDVPSWISNTNLELYEEYLEYENSPNRIREKADQEKRALRRLYDTCNRAVYVRN